MGMAQTVVPVHIPRDRIVDFDVYNPTLAAERYHQAFVDFQRRASHPLVWTAHHGGHWIAVRGDDVFALYADHENFSSRHYFVPATPDQVLMGAFTLDPPAHQPFRAFLTRGLPFQNVSAKTPLGRIDIQAIQSGMAAR